ncbi:cyclic nucleotide-binding domain-containing protein [Thalassospiraceae bacterium LMO-JJ14]|nr:cyclic nucleotide-binding domain-containing protein [Thalassospiraceae bacterium LMO-JJ14]
MSWLEILGYIASGAVFVTFWMKTIIPLRLVALAGNALYLGYGINSELGNIILLHGSLLPLNLFRLYQAVMLRKRLHEMAHSAFDPGSLLPFMSPVERSVGSFLFQRGDNARDIFYLMDGTLRIEELNLQIQAGQLVGEIAMFAPDKTRTQTIKCETDCKLMRITEDKTLQLYAENPEFGLYVTKMMVARLLENAQTSNRAIPAAPA